MAAVQEVELSSKSPDVDNADQIWELLHGTGVLV